MFVKPAKNLKISNPEAGYTYIPDEGCEVPETSYWMRRLSVGDIEIVESAQSQDNLGASEKNKVKNK